MLVDFNCWKCRIVIVSLIYYCNSVLYGLPANRLALLQRVLHAAVNLVANLDCCDHVTPAMKELHWVSVAYHFKYKLSHNARGSKQQKCGIHHQYTCYDIVTASLWVASFAKVQGFRNTQHADQIWKKGLSIASPTVWNELSNNVWRTENVSTYKRAIKAHLFNLTYDC